MIKHLKYYVPLIVTLALSTLAISVFTLFPVVEADTSRLFKFQLFGLLSVTSLLWTVSFIFAFIASFSNLYDDISDVIIIESYAIADIKRLKPFVQHRIRAETGRAAISAVGVFIGLTALIDGHVPRLSRSIGDEILLGLLGIAIIISIMAISDRRDRTRENNLRIKALIEATMLNKAKTTSTSDSHS